MNYFISNNGVQKGPLTFEQLKEQEINKDTLVWKEGTSDWVKASEVEELVPILELLPPPVDNIAKDNVTDETVTKDAEVDDRGRKIVDNTKMFSHFLTFKGRSRRTEYIIVFVIMNSLCKVCAPMIEDDPAVSLIIVAALYIFLSTAVRRCHDRGHSGFYILIPLYYIYLLWADSVPGTNKYGNNPKGEYFQRLY